MVYTMAPTDYYTSCADTSIYRDHRNLGFILDPMQSHPNIPSYLVSKIQRWALILSQYAYVASHVPGEFNNFPVLMTRCGATPKVRRLYMLIPDVESHTFEKEAIWEYIGEAQNAMPPAEAAILTVGSKESRGFLLPYGKTYVPKNGDSNQHRFADHEPLWSGRTQGQTITSEF